MSLFVHVLGDQLGAFQIATARFVSQFLYAGLGVWWTKPAYGFFGPPEKRKLLVLRGVAGTGGMTLAYFTLTHLPLADATAVVFTAPVITAIMAAIVLREKFSAFEGVSVMLCFAGVVLVSQPTWIFGSNESNSTDTQAVLTVPRWVAVLTGLGASLFASCAYLAVRKMGKGVSVNVMVLYFAVAGTILAPILAFATEGFSPLDGSVQQTLLLLGCGIFGYVGQILLNTGLQLEKAAPATMMRNLDVVLAFLFQWLVLHEDPNVWSIAGAVLIASCAILIAIAKGRKQAADPASSTTDDPHIAGTTDGAGTLSSIHAPGHEDDRVVLIPGGPGTSPAAVEMTSPRRRVRSGENQDGRGASMPTESIDTDSEEEAADLHRIHEALRAMRATTDALGGGYHSDGGVSSDRSEGSVRSAVDRDMGHGMPTWRGGYDERPLYNQAGAGDDEASSDGSDGVEGAHKYV